MKKILIILFIFTTITTQAMPVLALNIGTYKTETEYGLLDGFKFNWKKTDKNTPFVEPREQSSKREYDKEYQQYKDTEYERTRYMYEGKSIL